MANKLPSLSELFRQPAFWQSEESRRDHPAPIARPDRVRRPKDDRRGSITELAMSILTYHQQLQPLLELYDALETDPDTATINDKLEFSEGFKRLFSDLMRSRFSALPEDVLIEELSIDEPTFKRLKNNEVSYEEAINLFVPVLLLLEATSRGNLQ